MIETQSSKGVESIAGLYLFLGRCFSYPTEDLYKTVSRTEVADELGSLIAGLPFEIDFKGIPPSLPQDEFESEYINNFDITPSCPLYESSYTRGDMAGRDIYEDILRFYEHFEIKLNEREKDYPDHLVAELEFMAFLSKKEADARERGIDSDPYRLAQIDFLERHLRKWVPLLCEKVNVRVKEPFYQRTGELLRDFVDSHYLFLKTKME